MQLWACQADLSESLYAMAQDAFVQDALEDSLGTKQHIVCALSVCKSTRCKHDVLEESCTLVPNSTLSAHSTPNMRE